MREPINQITRADVNNFNSLRELQLVKYSTADLYQDLAIKSAFYPGQGTPLGLIYCSLKLNGEAGELAEHVGKAMRDDGLTQFEFLSQNGENAVLHFDQLTPDRRAKIIKEAGDVLWYVSAICKELGITLSEAMAENLDKLCKRTEDGTLSGSGDER